MKSKSNTLIKPIGYGCLSAIATFMIGIILSTAIMFLLTDVFDQPTELTDYIRRILVRIIQVATLLIGIRVFFRYFRRNREAPKTGLAKDFPGEIVYRKEDDEK